MKNITIIIVFLSFFVSSCGQQREKILMTSSSGEFQAKVISQWEKERISLSVAIYSHDMKLETFFDRVCFINSNEQFVLKWASNSNQLFLKANGETFEFLFNEDQWEKHKKMTGNQ